MRTQHVPCFLVEWYRPEFGPEPRERSAAALSACAESMTANGCPVELVTMLAVPSDESLFAVFTAGSADLVAKTCDQAGMPAQRLTAADITLSRSKG